MRNRKKSPLTRDWATLQTESLMGDVIHPTWVAQLSIEPCLNESNAKVKKIKQITKNILKNIEEYKKRVINIDFRQPIKTILKSIYNFFCLRHNGQSKYACYKMKNGGFLDFRLALHDGVGDNFKDPTHLNISVYICYKYFSNRGISSTPYQEYEISPDLFEKNPKMVMDALVDAVGNAIDTGKFILDEKVGKQIDTTVQDTTQDLIQRYGYSNGEPLLFTFMDKDHKRYNFELRQVKECSESKIIISVLTQNGTNMIVVNPDNSVFINSVKITPTRDVKNWWVGFIECLRRLAKRNNNIKTESRNMNKKLIRLTESTLNKIVKESVNQVLTELDWRTADSAMIGAANDMFTPSESHNEKRKRQHDLFLKKRLEYMMQQYDLTKEQVLFTIRTNEKDFENMTKLFRDYNKYFADDNFSEYDNGEWQ